MRRQRPTAKSRWNRPGVGSVPPAMSTLDFLQTTNGESVASTVRCQHKERLRCSYADSAPRLIVSAALWTGASGDVARASNDGSPMIACTHASEPPT